MNKTISFLNRLVTTLNTVDTDTLKSSIGDSTNNNRTVTVNQAIRFFTRSGKRRLASNLRTVYSSRQVRSLIRAIRATSRRTDAVDINELLSAVNVASHVASFNRSLGRSL